MNRAMSYFVLILDYKWIVPTTKKRAESNFKIKINIYVRIILLYNMFNNVIVLLLDPKQSLWIHARNSNCVNRKSIIYIYN